MITARPLNGLGAPDAGVAQLQAALTRLAASTGNGAMNPGPATGEMTPQTMSAIAQAFDLISPEIPFLASTAVQAAFMVGAQTSAAAGVVQQYAMVLAGAVDAANTKWISQHGSAAGGGGALPTTTPWYQTPVGIVGLVVGGFVAYKMFFGKASASSQKASA